MPDSTKDASTPAIWRRLKTLADNWREAAYAYRRGDEGQVNDERADAYENCADELETALRACAEALAPPEPPTKAWLLTERRKDGRIVNEAIALTNDAAREWVSDPNMEFGQARSSLPLKVFPAPPRADALDAPPDDNLGK